MSRIANRSTPTRRLAMMLACGAWMSTGCVGPGAEGRKPPPDMAVDVSVRAVTSPEPRLRVTVINRTPREVTTYDHLLPRLASPNLLLVAVKVDAAGRVLERSLPTSAPMPNRVTLRPGESWTEELPLPTLFPGLRAALTERDVVLLWSYQFQTIDRERLPRVAGGVVFPRGVGAAQ